MALADVVIRNIKSISSVSEISSDGNSEWFHVKSHRLPDHELFNELRAKWHTTLGPLYGLFALVHCVQQPHAGVWIHDLSTAAKPAAYLPGCFKISSWG